ncbi:MAG: hypothetical protein R3E12_00240 [Candidatus Eisenbacteria bacterium]|uniref:Flagellar hook-length control protein FliK n=1 Tax=Eiseniibacteriota bacterium TaxID=2212470 RepID=A0A956M118_UNCEI|nr:flagellar hook-length control protein FliK [Candidatus Eisenbacteria bacterium]
MAIDPTGNTRIDRTPRAPERQSKTDRNAPGHATARSFASILEQAGVAGSVPLPPSSTAPVPDLGSDPGNNGSSANGAEPAAFSGSTATPAAGPSYSSAAESAAARNETAARREEENRDSGSAAAAESTSAASRSHTPAPAKQAAPAPNTQQLQTLLHKLVETFRVGQSGTGDAQVQMNLKATAFDGMGVQLTRNPQGISALLSVDRIATKDALEAQVSDLVSRMEAKGLRVDEVRVEVRETPSGNQSGFSQDSHESADEAWSTSGNEGPAPSGIRPHTPRAARHTPRLRESGTDYTL